jgi:hypothetical protein
VPAETTLKTIIGTTTKEPTVPPEAELPTVGESTIPVIVIGGETTPSAVSPEYSTLPTMSTKASTRGETTATEEYTVPRESEIPTFTTPSEVETTPFPSATKSTTMQTEVTSTGKEVSHQTRPKDVTVSGTTLYEASTKSNIEFTTRETEATTQEETPAFTETVPKIERTTLPGFNLVTGKSSEAPLTTEPTEKQTSPVTTARIPVTTSQTQTTVKVVEVPSPTQAVTEHAVSKETIEMERKTPLATTPTQTEETKAFTTPTTLKTEQVTFTSTSVEGEITTELRKTSETTTTSTPISTVVPSTTQAAIITKITTEQVATQTTGTTAAPVTTTVTGEKFETGTETTTAKVTTTTREGYTVTTPVDSTIETYNASSSSEVTARTIFETTKMPQVATSETYTTEYVTSTGETTLTVVPTSPVPIETYTERTNLTNICNSDMDCAPFETCLCQQCINTCAIGGRCAPNAICSAQNHTAICMCPPGYSGDPKRNCLQGISHKLFAPRIRAPV